MLRSILLILRNTKEIRKVVLYYGYINLALYYIYIIIFPWINFYEAILTVKDNTYNEYINELCIEI